MSIQGNINKTIKDFSDLYADVKKNKYLAKGTKYLADITEGFKTSSEMFEDLTEDAKKADTEELVRNTVDTRDAEISEDEVMDRDMTLDEQIVYEDALRDPMYKEPFKYKGMGMKASDLLSKLKAKGDMAVDEVNAKAKYAQGVDEVID